MEVTLRNITYAYENKVALKNINIKFKGGKINGIVGPSGSGKTTLLEILDVLLVPTIGSVIFDDVVVNKYKKIENINDIRRKIGLLYQFPEEQFCSISVLDELSLSLKLFNISFDQDICINVLKMVGLNESYLDKSLYSLSNGDKRKIALASILIYDPEIIILDEPTVGLNGLGKKDFIKLIKALKNKYKKTIIVVSHDIDFIHEIADYLYVIDEGVLITEGNKYDVFNSDEYKSSNLDIPRLISFSNMVKDTKGIKLGYRDDINDLIKDIYRCAK